VTREGAIPVWAERRWSASAFPTFLFGGPVMKEGVGQGAAEALVELVFEFNRRHSLGQ
jgi:hypothetical protein